MTQTISAQELFNGERWLSEVAIEINNGKVISIKKDGYDHNNAYPLVVPALIDLQIYGAYGKLLSRVSPKRLPFKKYMTIVWRAGCLFSTHASNTKHRRNFKMY
jgi:N-acetylglucosamine-6-phosphate deacetylase